jgi:hypothetical protein
VKSTQTDLVRTAASPPAASEDRSPVTPEPAEPAARRRS